MLTKNPGLLRVVPVILVLLSGCTSLDTGQYGQFSAAIKNVDTSTTQTLGEMESSVRNYAVLTAPVEPITEDSFKPVTDDKTSYDFSNPVKKMEATLKVLVLYARSLDALSGEKVDTDLDKPAEDLAKSIKDLKTVQINISPDKVDAIATGFDAVGRVMVEKQRKTALKKAMSQAQPGIDELIRAMTGDLENLDLAINLMRASYLTHANVARPAYGTWNRYDFDLKVAAQLSDYERTKKSLAVIRNAIQKIPTINQHLLLSLEDDRQNLDNLKEFVHQAKSLDGVYQSLSTQ